MTGLVDDCQEALPSHGREDALSGKPVEDTKAHSFLECVWLFLLKLVLLKRAGHILVSLFVLQEARGSSGAHFAMPEETCSDHIFVFGCKS